MGNFAGFQKTEDFYIHQRLGRIRRIQQEDGPQLIQYKVLAQSEDKIQEWRQVLGILNFHNCQSVLFLPTGYSWQRIGFCGRNCQVFLLYGDYMFCLKKEIKDRRAIKRNFSQSSVWEILYKLIMTQNILQKNKLKIGNVKPQNIIVNQEGNFRIISYFSYPGAENSILADQEEDSNLYSPEQWIEFKKRGSDKHKIQLELKKIESNNLKVNKDDQKSASQIFSIGATILQICSLEESKQIYLKNGTINEDLILKRLNSIQRTYKKSLTSLLQQMLKTNPAERIKLEELYSILEPYHQLILSQKLQTIQHRFCLNTQLQNNSFETNATMDSTRSRKQQKSSKNKWERFSNFFPFMLQIMPKTKSQSSMKGNDILQNQSINASKNRTV